MNYGFEQATPIEKAKISFVQINLDELRYYAEQSPKGKRQFFADLCNALLSKGAKSKNTLGYELAKNSLARSYTSLKKSSEGGKHKNNSEDFSNDE